MTLEIWVPLHSDLTVLGGEIAHFDQLDACVAAVSDLIAKRLRKHAIEHWPQLRRIYIDCLLCDREKIGAGARFTSRDGQLLLGFSMDFRSSMGADPFGQALAVYGRILATLEYGLTKKQQPELAAEVKTFARKHGDAVLREVFREAVEALDDDEDRTDSTLPLESGPGRLRYVKSLGKAKGRIWVMLRTGRRHDRQAAERIGKAIEKLLVEEDCGHRDGSSAGLHCSDFTYSVKNRAKSAAIVASLFDEKYPDIDYIVSDDYEILIDPETAQLLPP